MIAHQRQVTAADLDEFVFAAGARLGDRIAHAELRAAPRCDIGKIIDAIAREERVRMRVDQPGHHHCLTGIDFHHGGRARAQASCRCFAVGARAGRDDPTAVDHERAAGHDAEIGFPYGGGGRCARCKRRQGEQRSVMDDVAAPTIAAYHVTCERSRSSRCK